MSRLLPVLAGILITVGGGWLLLTVVHGRDKADVGAQQQASAGGPGTLEEDLGDVVRKGAGVGRLTTPAPTSGPHAQQTPTRDEEVDDAQLLTALALGDVAFVYGDRRPPAGLQALQERLAGPFDPELAAAGQAVLLVRRKGTEGVQALAWRRRLQASSPRDGQLSAFVDAWLGRGADSTG